MRVALPSVGAGLLLTLSVPPSGFWPLAIVGFAILYWRLAGLDWRWRLLAGAATGLGLFVPGIYWTTDFQQFGYVALVLLELSFVALGAVLTPPGRGRALAFPAAMLLSEALRGRVPFGGFPLSGVALGQVAGPLAFSARIGGGLLLVGLAAALGVGLAEARRRRVVVPVAIAAGTAALVLIGVLDSSTERTGELRVALVQGGGPRGVRGIHADPAAVFRRHVDTTRTVEGPVDLVLWPEDVVDLTRPLRGSEEEATIAQLADDLDTTLIAGVVEDVAADRFRNAAVAFGPDGQALGRYDKVHRVPFGEYVPGRDLIGKIADLSIIPRDAIAGDGDGMLTTPAGRLGVVISYEVFFSDRARSAIRAGGEVLLVPTNASSYKTSQVPTQELSAARLRAIETGRAVIQAGPTGYTAIIDERGRLVDRGGLGEARVVTGTIERRRGLTPYQHLGDWPLLLVAATMLAGGWAMSAQAGRRIDAVPEPPAAPFSEVDKPVESTVS